MFFLFKSLGFSLANIGLVWVYHDHTLHKVYLTYNIAVMALQSHGSEDLFCCSNHSSPISEAISTKCTSAFPLRAGWKGHRVSLEYLLRAFMTDFSTHCYQNNGELRQLYRQFNQPRLPSLEILSNEYSMEVGVTELYKMHTF